MSRGSGRIRVEEAVVRAIAEVRAPQVERGGAKPHRRRKAMRRCRRCAWYVHGIIASRRRGQQNRNREQRVVVVCRMRRQASYSRCLRVARST